MSRQFGSQCIVLECGCPYRAEGSAPTPSGWEVTTHGGRCGTGIDASNGPTAAPNSGWGRSAELDGRRRHQAGFDLPMLPRPGGRHGAGDRQRGAGAVEHFVPAVRAGADAVLAASVFHFGEMSIGEVKAAMAADGIEVRVAMALDPAIAARLKSNEAGCSPPSCRSAAR